MQHILVHSKMNGICPLLTAPPVFAFRQLSIMHYPLSTADKYFQAPEPDEEYTLTLCGDTVIFSNALLVEALSRLDTKKREMVYLSFFQKVPQHEIGRRYGRSRSTAGYHIRKALRQLQAEMEGMAYEE